jgi:glycosyltransferase involved in cell wall biosynthesis
MERAPASRHPAGRRCPPERVVIVNQWLPNAHYGDAMGDNARRVRTLLRQLGHSSDVYAIHIEPELAGDVLPFDDPTARSGDMTIFHYGVYSPMTTAFKSLRGRRVLQYHNVTPAAFFSGWDANLFDLATRGREELPGLVDHVDVALGDSEFNRRELAAVGFARTGVFPIAVDTSRVTAPVSVPALEALLDDGVMNFLFVGRIVPNKMIEDHLKLAAFYTRYVGRDGRFLFVGRCDLVPQYYSALRGLMNHLRLRRDRVVFTDAVPEQELAIYYRHADVYISLSEHEGFCVPLVEAMAADVPVLAYAEAAVPETLGGAGVQFAQKNLELEAELLDELAFNDGLRDQVIAGQRRRLEDFSEARLRRELGALVGSLS